MNKAILPGGPTMDYRDPSAAQRPNYVVGARCISCWNQMMLPRFGVLECDMCGNVQSPYRLHDIDSVRDQFDPPLPPAHPAHAGRLRHIVLYAAVIAASVYAIFAVL